VLTGGWLASSARAGRAWSESGAEAPASRGGRGRGLGRQNHGVGRGGGGACPPAGCVHGRVPALGIHHVGGVVSASALRC
jgi:hypothetical protein